MIRYDKVVEQDITEIRNQSFGQYIKNPIYFDYVFAIDSEYNIHFIDDAGTIHNIGNIEELDGRAGSSPSRVRLFKYKSQSNSAIYYLGITYEDVESFSRCLIIEFDSSTHEIIKYTSVGNSQNLRAEETGFVYDFLDNNFAVIFGKTQEQNDGTYVVLDANFEDITSTISLNKPLPVGGKLISNYATNGVSLTAIVFDNANEYSEIIITLLQRRLTLIASKSFGNSHLDLTNNFLVFNPPDINYPIIFSYSELTQCIPVDGEYVNREITTELINGNLSGCSNFVYSEGYLFACDGSIPRVFEITNKENLKVDVISDKKTIKTYTDITRPIVKIENVNDSYLKSLKFYDSSDNQYECPMPTDKSYSAINPLEVYNDESVDKYDLIGLLPLNTTTDLTLLDDIRIVIKDNNPYYVGLDKQTSLATIKTLCPSFNPDNKQIVFVRTFFTSNDDVGFDVGLGYLTKDGDFRFLSARNFSDTLLGTFSTEDFKFSDISFCTKFYYLAPGKVIVKIYVLLGFVFYLWDIENNKIVKIDGDLIPGIDADFAYLSLDSTGGFLIAYYNDGSLKANFAVFDLNTFTIDYGQIAPYQESENTNVLSIVNTDTTTSLNVYAIVNNDLVNKTISKGGLKFSGDDVTTKISFDLSNAIVLRENAPSTYFASYYFGLDKNSTAIIKELDNRMFAGIAEDKSNLRVVDTPDGDSINNSYTIFLFNESNFKGTFLISTYQVGDTTANTFLVYQLQEEKPTVIARFQSAGSSTYEDITKIVFIDADGVENEITSINFDELS